MIEYNVSLTGKTILITGSAGFIGASLTLDLLQKYKPACVIGIDNMNDYYDVSIKKWRLNEIERAVAAHPETRWVFIKGSIADKSLVDSAFAAYKLDIVLNLAAQAGVRYSITDPDPYIESKVRHLL